MTAGASDSLRADRVVALYDIHGNVAALERVLEEVQSLGATRFVVGGDVVPGPFAPECFELLRSLSKPVDWLLGNGEVAVLAAARGEPSPYALPPSVWQLMRWQASQLSGPLVEWIGGWPKRVRLEHSTLGSVSFCHGTPRSENEIFTRRTSDELLVPLFANESPLVVCGHTHMPFDRRIGASRVLNAGSVGMPFGEMGAQWLLLGDDIEFRRTAYDLDSAVRRVQTSSSYPDMENWPQEIRSPRSEEEAIELFSSAELLEG